MATAYQITGAKYALFLSAPGPYSYGGSLFVIGLSELAAPAGKIGLFKSADGGETWARVGSEIEIYGTNIGSQEQLYIGTCPGISDQFAFVAYLGTDRHIHVSRADLGAETFDTDADSNIDVVEAPCRLTLAQATDGHLGLTVSIGARKIVDVEDNRTDQVSTVTLSSDLGSWGTLTDVPGQPTSGPGQFAVGTARGTDGRVHGFANALGTLGTQFAHVGDGDTFDLLATFISGGGDLQAATAEDASGNVALGHAVNGSGVGGPFYRVAITSAASADSPSWTTTPVSASDTSPQQIALQTTTEALYQIGGAGDIISSLSGTILDPGTGVGLAGRGAGFIFAGDGNQLWYVPYAALTITGVSGIESGEMFGRTHGVGGGGEPPQCGPGTPVLPAECGTSNPTIPTPPGEQNQCGTSLGYAY
jgi:hypothetical protein